MGKVIKIAVGVILLGISAFYLLGVYLMITDAREDAAYKLSSSVRAEYLGSEYLGGRMELDGNEEQAEEVLSGPLINSLSRVNALLCKADAIISASPEMPGNKKILDFDKLVVKDLAYSYEIGRAHV